MPTTHSTPGPGPVAVAGPALAPVAPVASGQARITVTCDFADGWAAVLPKGVVDPAKDEFAMQALIGLREDPAFWQSESDYKALEPYAAERCDLGRATFRLPAGELIILVGQAKTFDKKGGYQDNGAMRELTAQVGEDVTQHFSQRDLVLDFSCISCPWLEEQTASGWQRRAEILVDLYGEARATTQRRALGELTVLGGHVHIRIAEDDDEVSHLDALTLELGHLRVTTTLRGTFVRGDRMAADLAVALPDGRYPAVAVATGYYTPNVPVRHLHRK